MVPLARIMFRKLAAAGAFVVSLSTVNIYVSAQEIVQNLGPVGPNDGILATIGTMHVVAFFEPRDGRCAVNAVVWDDLGSDAGESAKRVLVKVEAGELLLIETSKQESLNLQCGSNAATLAAIDIQGRAASGITAQPPRHPVRPGD